MAAGPSEVGRKGGSQGAAMRAPARVAGAALFGPASEPVLRSAARREDRHPGHPALFGVGVLAGQEPFGGAGVPSGLLFDRSDRRGERERAKVLFDLALSRRCEREEGVWNKGGAFVIRKSYLGSVDMFNAS